MANRGLSQECKAGSAFEKSINGIHYIDKCGYTAIHHIFMAKTSTISQVKNDKLAESMRNMYHRLWDKTSNSCEETLKNILDIQKSCRKKWTKDI